MSELQRRGSEDVIINSPMSFAGAAQRGWRLRRREALPGPPWVSRISMTLVAVVVILLWWAAVVCWYLLFGLLLVPYRLLRRGARKRRQEALRHRETMAALKRDE